MTGDSRSLTRREFDAVIRRAAELASSEADGGEGGLTEAELFRIAGEVGLPQAQVRQALAEVRSGVEGGGVVDRLFGPRFVMASRVVSGAPDRVSGELDDFFVASQLLQPVRRGGSMLQYRPAVDWASQLARAASFTSRKYYVASAKSVEVRLERIDDERTLVDIQVDPGTRGDDLAGAIFGGGVAGVFTGIVAGFGLATFAPVAVAAGAGLVLGAGVTGGITQLVGRGHKRKLDEVTAELEGVLDALESGASLEPPPPSWRRWVKRHFHGVAQDLMRHEDDRGR